MPEIVTVNHRACAAIWAAGARKSAEEWRERAGRVRVEKARAFYRRKAEECTRSAERYEAFADGVDPTGIAFSLDDWYEASRLVSLE
jgi:hypothetical protein